MIRRINYTNRIRIRRKDILIKLREQTDGNWFDADLSKLSDYDLPPESLVFLEAYRQTNWMRFGYGHVGAPAPEKDLLLKQFDSPEGILFRVKVTASGDAHKLIAEADAIPLLMLGQEKIEKEPLLSVKFSHELGDEIYRIDFADDRPLLLINCEIENYREIAHSRVFLSLVYPAVLREILTHIIFVDRLHGEDDIEHWHYRWVRFVKQFSGVGEVPTNEDAEERTDWIQKAVAAFAKKQKTRDKFVEFWRNEA
jgi:hypothetical protein